MPKNKRRSLWTFIFVEIGIAEVESMLSSEIQTTAGRYSERSSKRGTLRNRAIFQPMRQFPTKTQHEMEVVSQNLPRQISTKLQQGLKPLPYG